MTGGIVIGRQWLFWDKIAVDVQAGPQYKYSTRSKSYSMLMTLGMQIIKYKPLEQNKIYLKNILMFTIPLMMITHYFGIMKD